MEGYAQTRSSAFGMSIHLEYDNFWGITIYKKITAEGKFAYLTKYRKHMHYLDAQKLLISTLVSVASYVICEGILNLGLLLHHSTGSISSDNKLTTPMVHIQPYCSLQWRIIVPNLGPWSGMVWEFFKKQK